MKPNPINSIGKKSSANEIFKYFFFHIFFRYLYGNPGSFISGLLLGQPPIIILFGGSNPSPKQLRNYYYTVYCRLHMTAYRTHWTLNTPQQKLYINHQHHNSSHISPTQIILQTVLPTTTLGPATYLLNTTCAFMLPALYSDIKPQITKNILNT